MIYEVNGIKPQVAESAWVAPNATVVGRVSLAEDSSVWFNAVIRGDSENISVGARSNIQDGSVVHADEGFPTVIEEDVTVGHKVMLHGCTIGAGSLVGINAVVLNGAKVGRNCLIASNALVREGQEIPDNSVVMGSPGKVVKELSEAAIEQIRRGAEHYVHNAVAFRDTMKVVSDD